VRDGWRIEKFGGICDLKKGRKPRLTNTKEPNVNPYLVAKYLRGAEPTDFAFIEDKNSIPVTADEIIIICDGSNSGETFIGFDGILSSTMAKIVHGNNIKNKFLIYFLELMFEKFNSSKTGSAIPHLDLNALRNQVLPVPPLPEQRRIVAILDEAFEGIATAKANAEKNLQNAHEVFESHLNAVFSQRGEGWVEKPLIDYSIFVSTGPFGSLLHKSDYGNTGIPLVNPINISGGFITPNNEKRVSNETAARLTNYILKSGDVVVARRGDIGRCAKIGDRESGWLCGTGCFFVRPKSNLDGDFLAHLIRSNPYREKLEVAASGATMLNLSNTSLSALRVAIPNIEIQRAILSQLNDLSDETQHLESIYQQKLAALDELKQSLLHQAFNGGL